MQKRPWLWINRAISSKFLTPLLAKTPLTPNQITVMSMSFGILSGIFLSIGAYESVIWGVIFYELACLFDNCDGEIARLKNLKSELGAKLDMICDVATDGAFFIGIFIGAFKWNIPGPLTVLFWIALLGLAAHYAIVFLEKKNGFGPAEHGKANPEGAERDSLFSDVLNAASEGEISLVVVVLGLTGMIYWLAWLLPLYINALWMVNLARNFRYL